MGTDELHFGLENGRINEFTRPRSVTQRSLDLLIILISL